MNGGSGFLGRWERIARRVWRLWLVLGIAFTAYALIAVPAPPTVYEVHREAYYIPALPYDPLNPQVTPAQKIAGERGQIDQAFANREQAVLRGMRTAERNCSGTVTKPLNNFFEVVDDLKTAGGDGEVLFFCERFGGLWSYYLQGVAQLICAFLIFTGVLIAAVEILLWIIRGFRQPSAGK